MDELSAKVGEEIKRQTEFTKQMQKLINDILKNKVGIYQEFLEELDKKLDKIQNREGLGKNTTKELEDYILYLAIVINKIGWVIDDYAIQSKFSEYEYQRVYDMAYPNIKGTEEQRKCTAREEAIMQKYASMVKRGVSDSMNHALDRAKLLLDSMKKVLSSRIETNRSKNL